MEAATGFEPVVTLMISSTYARIRGQQVGSTDGLALRVLDHGIAFEALGFFALEHHGQRRIATARSLGITRECLYK